MQEYRRQIAYLYAYEHGEKMRSAGFVKLEIRGGSCRIRVHLKSYCHPGESAGIVYVYFHCQDRIIGIRLGALGNQNGALEWQGNLDPENVQGKGIRVADTRGIWIRRPGERHYVADWDDYPVDVSRFLLYPSGGEKCIRCPWLGNCERNNEDASDRRREIYEGSYQAGT